jgi:hypothetical protein
MADLISSCMYSPNPNLYSFLAKEHFDRVQQIVPLTSRFHTKVTEFDTVTFYSENDLLTVVDIPNPSSSTSAIDIEYANRLLTECNTNNEI